MNERIVELLEEIISILRDVPNVASEPATPESTLTLEDVRGKLAEISRRGHTDEIKALLEKYGAEKLSSVDPSNYAALLADAEAICDD